MMFKIQTQNIHHLQKLSLVHDIRFDDRSRNVQYTANSVVFFAFASVLKEKWTGLDIDRILMLGDHIYTVSYEIATKNGPRPNQFLAAHEIVQRIFVTVSRFDNRRYNCNM